MTSCDGFPFLVWLSAKVRVQSILLYSWDKKNGFMAISKLQKEHWCGDECKRPGRKLNNFSTLEQSGDATNKR